jgi:hypothetical protein
MYRRGQRVIKITELSNKNISLIFNHILKACLEKVKEREVERDEEEEDE